MVRGQRQKSMWLINLILVRTERHAVKNLKPNMLDIQIVCELGWTCVWETHKLGAAASSL